MASTGASIPAILCIGEDMELLETRSAVLRKTGAEVKCLTSAQARETDDLSAFDLIVLCHTMEEPEARRIADDAGRLQPAPLILLLNSLSARGQDRSGIRFDAVAEVIPELLVRTATELLSRRSGASRLRS